jgi:hypothetical protein
LSNHDVYFAYSQCDQMLKNHPMFEKVAKTVAEQKMPKYLHQC